MLIPVITDICCRYKLKSGTVGYKQHIRSIVDIDGEELVVKFYHEQDVFENAKEMYGKVAKADFICQYATPSGSFLDCVTSKGRRES